MSVQNGTVDFLSKKASFQDNSNLVLTQTLRKVNSYIVLVVTKNEKGQSVLLTWSICRYIFLHLEIYADIFFSSRMSPWRTRARRASRILRTPKATPQGSGSSLQLRGGKLNIGGELKNHTCFFFFPVCKRIVDRTLRCNIAEFADLMKDLITFFYY